MIWRAEAKLKQARPRATRSNFLGFSGETPRTANRATEMAIRTVLAQNMLALSTLIPT